MKEEISTNDILKFGNVKVIIEYKGKQVLVDVPKEIKYYIIWGLKRMLFLYQKMENVWIHKRSIVW